MDIQKLPRKSEQQTKSFLNDLNVLNLVEKRSRCQRKRSFKLSSLVAGDVIVDNILECEVNEGQEFECEEKEGNQGQVLKIEKNLLLQILNEDRECLDKFKNRIYTLAGENQKRRTSQMGVVRNFSNFLFQNRISSGFSPNYSQSLQNSFSKSQGNLQGFQFGQNQTREETLLEDPDSKMGSIADQFRLQRRSQRKARTESSQLLTLNNSLGDSCQNIQDRTKTQVPTNERVSYDSFNFKQKEQVRSLWEVLEDGKRHFKRDTQMLLNNLQANIVGNEKQRYKNKIKNERGIMMDSLRKAYQGLLTKIYQNSEENVKKDSIYESVSTKILDQNLKELITGDNLLKKLREKSQEIQKPAQICTNPKIFDRIKVIVTHQYTK